MLSKLLLVLCLLNGFVPISSEFRSSMFAGKFFEEPMTEINSVQVQCYQMHLDSDDQTDLLQKALRFYEDNFGKALRWMQNLNKPKNGKLDQELLDKMPLCSEEVLQELYSEMSETGSEQGFDIVEMAQQAERHNFEANYPYACHDFHAFSEIIGQTPTSMQMKASIKSSNLSVLFRVCMPVVQFDGKFELSDEELQKIESATDRAADL